MPRSSVQTLHGSIIGNALTLCKSIQCGRSPWMNTQTYALDQSRVLAAETVDLLQSCYSWGALPIGQPFCPSQTTSCVASLRLSCLMRLMKCAGRPRFLWTMRTSETLYGCICIPCWCCFFTCCMCICCMPSYVASSCVNVQVDVSHFRSFDVAYEGSVLWVYINALYIATYVHTYLLGFTLSARIRGIPA